MPVMDLSVPTVPGQISNVLILLTPELVMFKTLKK